MRPITSALIALGAMISLPALAAVEDDTPLTACDMLAAHPADPNIVATGVPRRDIDLDAAIAACQRELDTYEDSPRLTYQLGRVLFYNGDMANGAALVNEAAEMGWTQAIFVSGLIDRNQEGKMCQVGEKWLAAARDGLKAAQIGFSRDVLAGRYENCDLDYDAADVGEFLDATEERTSGWYEGLLHEDLRMAYAAWVAKMDAE